GHFARECKTKGNQDSRRRDAYNSRNKDGRIATHQQGQLWYEEKIRFMKIDLDEKTDVLTYHKKLLVEVEKEKEDLKAKVEKWHNSSKNLDCSIETHESLPEPTVNEPKVVNQPKVWSDAPIIEEYESDSEDELSHLIRDYDFHEKRMTKQAELNNSMRMKSSQREIRPIWNNVQIVN
ncbi:hypothetical protein Tco_0054872, partial [Tanacetum coccineum]